MFRRLNLMVVLATALSAMVFAIGTADAGPVYAFFSFDNLQNGTGGVNANVTAETFPGTPTRTRTGTTTVTTGGELSFTDFQGNTWLGSGNQNTPGNSLAWNAGSTGNSFTHNLDMTGLTDLSLRMAIRSATATTATPITAFTSIEYSIGGPFMTAASGADLLIPISGNNFVEYLLDLSSLSAIENQPNVALRFTFGTIPTNTSFRYDNIQFTAQTIPEPASFALWSLLSLGLAGYAYRHLLRR
jgi:hypothetical protein